MSKLITELNNMTQSKSSIHFDCSPVNDFYPELISTEESLGNKLKIYNDVIDSFSTIFGKIQQISTIKNGLLKIYQKKSLKI
jgi:hypothetical protein